MIIDRIKAGVDSNLGNEQDVFRKGRSTTEQIIFILRNIVEQFNNSTNGKQLYLNFIDFEKAFDSVDRISLCQKMRMYGIPEKLTRLVRVMILNVQ